MKKIISLCINIILMLFSSFVGLISVDIPVCDRHNALEDPNAKVYNIDNWYTNEPGGESGINLRVHHISCYNPGPYDCPLCSMALPDNYIGPLTQTFVNLSANMMNNYIAEQYEDSIFSGTQSFNTYFNDTYIYRNVTWDCSDSGSSIYMYVSPIIFQP